MEHLMQFRDSASTLSNDEYESLIKSVDRKDVMTALFNFYYKRFEDNNDCSKIKQINNKISEIVHQRNKSDKVKHTHLPSPQLHNISKPLINHICSYLDDSTCFERVCRRIYIASKSPQYMYHVVQSDIKKYVDYCNQHKKSVNLNKFSDVQCFGYFYNYYGDDDDYNPFANHLFNMNNLIELNLDEEQLEVMMSLKHISLRKIKILRLSSVFDITYLSNLFQQTPNLEVLQLNEVDIDQLDLSNEIIKNTISKLKGLQFLETPGDIGANMISDIINLCGFQLQALDLYDLTSFNLNINFKKFVNLIELRLAICSGAQLKEMISFMDSFKKVQRVHLRIYLKFLNQSKSDELRKFLTVLFGLDSLDVVEIDAFWNYDLDIDADIKLMRLIEQSLMNIAKSRLKIIFRMDGAIRAKVCNEQIGFNFSSLVNSLGLEIQDDFMCVVKLNNRQMTPKTKQNIKNWLDRRKQKLFVDYDTNVSWFVVCNKQCKINGYSQKWILS